MKRILIALLSLLWATAHAQVYQWTDADGKVHFSDRPGPDAQPIEVTPVQTISVPPVPTGASGTSAQDAPGPGKSGIAYAAFTIVSPTADEEIRANDGNVTVRLSLRPALVSGHVISLTVSGEDGQQTVSVKAMGVPLSNLSRGRHTVSATVVDGKGVAQISAAPVSFNVLRATAPRKSPR